MAKKKEGVSRMDAEILETARALHELGIMDDATFGKITLRQMNLKNLKNLKNLENSETPSGAEIVAIREANNMSQAVFAKVLDVTPGTLSKWEREEQRPRGPAARLLAVIKAKGVRAVL